MVNRSNWVILICLLCLVFRANPVVKVTERVKRSKERRRARRRGLWEKARDRSWRRARLLVAIGSTTDLVSPSRMKSSTRAGRISPVMITTTSQCVTILTRLMGATMLMPEKNVIAAGTYALPASVITRVPDHTRCIRARMVSAERP